ncbi:glycosyltransferase [Priestia megaterium]
MKPKILVISELYPNKEKPAFGIFVERQVNQLKEKYDVVVVAPIRVFPPLSIFKDLFKLKIKSFFYNIKKWKNDLKKIPEHQKINEVEVYYPRYTSLPRQVFHSTWGFFLYTFQKKFFEELQKRNNFELIHAHYATAPGLCALYLKKVFNIPVVLSIHGSDVYYTVHQNRMAKNILKFIFDKVDYIVTNSTITNKKVLEIGGRIETTEIVRLGGEFNKKQAPLGSVKHCREINILTVGYLEERKGHIYVLKALKSLIKLFPGIKYYIVGNGPKEEELQTYVKENNMSENVIFEGYKPHKEAISYFEKADIFILPSWNEAFGVVYVEALAHSVPVIGCRGEGGPEDLSNLGNCILLVEKQNVTEIEENLLKLIKSEDLRYRMGNVGKGIVNQHFTWKKNAEKMSNIYDRLIASSNIRN